MVIDAFPQANPAFVLTFAALVGLCIGSFLNVVIHRLPIMIDAAIGDDSSDTSGNHKHTTTNLVVPASACPDCGTELRIRDNIPVISYLILRGRCAHCNSPISKRYPLVEILGALAVVFATMAMPTPLMVIGAAVFSCALLALFVIDLEHYLLPDVITLPLLWLGLLINIKGTFTDLPMAVVGAVVGYLILWAVYHAFRLITGKEGLGYGDFKLVAAIGAWLGWQMLPLVILMSSLLGALVGGAYILMSKRGRDHPIPFGPFLAGAGWVSMFWGQTIIDEYIKLLNIG